MTRDRVRPETPRDSGCRRGQQARCTDTAERPGPRYGLAGFSLIFQTQRRPSRNSHFQKAERRVVRARSRRDDDEYDDDTGNVSN